MSYFDVFGLGNSLMDIQAFVPDSVLEKLKIKKGIMHLIDEEKSREILDIIKDYNFISLPGGSTANTMSCIAMLGGKSIFTGYVSNDIYGNQYEEMLQKRGVKTIIIKKNYGITGTSIILTTNDAERTMNTHLGVCREFSIADIDLDILSKSKIFHTSGYKWDTEPQKETVEFTMKKAKDMGLKISFDIADPFCIERNVNDFEEIIKKYVNILFGNREEVRILTGLSDPVEAGKKIANMGVEIVLVKVGKDGSYLFYNNKIIKIDVFNTDKVLDSTGCGDIYAGGFLYGFTNGFSIEQSAKIASYMATKILEVPGVQLEKLDFNEIKRNIKNL